MKGNAQAIGEIRDEPRILAGRAAANPVLQMRDFEVKPKLIAALVKQLQQRDRIRSSGNANQDSLASGNQLMTADERQNSTAERHRANSARFSTSMQGDVANPCPPNFSDCLILDGGKYT